MARQIRVGLNSGKKEEKLNPVGLASNRLRGALVRLMANSSADSATRTKAFEVAADQKSISLEGPTLKRMEIFR
jgi:hypothetical protein